MFNKKKELKYIIPGSKSSCNVNSNLSITGGLEVEKLKVNTISSLGEDVVAEDLNVSGMGTLQGNLSVFGLANLGSSTICNGNVDIKYTSITGLSNPVDPQDGVNFSYYLSSYPDVFQYVSTQYEKEFVWYHNTLLDWEALKYATYGTENAVKMLSFQGGKLYLLLPGIYHIAIDLNKAYMEGDTGGQMNLSLVFEDGLGSIASQSIIAMGNNYTQYVLAVGNASICNSLGCMFSISKEQSQNGTYLGLENINASYNTDTTLTYFNYRIIRYPFV